MTSSSSALLEEVLVRLMEDELFVDIAKVERILAEHRIEVVDDDLLDYAESLLILANEDEFSLDEKDFFGKVGRLVRTVAHKIGTAQGKVQGVKDRWAAFKKSVTDTHTRGRDSGRAATATDQTAKNQPKGTKPKGWEQQAQKQRQQAFKAKKPSLKAQLRGAKVGARSTRKDGTVWQKDKDGSWTQVNSAKKKQPKLRLVKPLAASAEPSDLDARLDEILARMGRG